MCGSFWVLDLSFVFSFCHTNYGIIVALDNIGYTSCSMDIVSRHIMNAMAMANASVSTIQGLLLEFHVAHAY